MSEVLQANIFFFVTGISIIILTLLLCVGLYHVIRILKSVRKIMDRIEYGSEVIAEDISSMRKHFAETSLVSSLLGVFLGRSGSKAEARKKRKEAGKTSGTSLTIKDED